ncbi:MAG: sigma-54 dependent transcriptional regulator [Bacteroidetes bacterium]|nr:sigma-54 dependent transcriptional regulator [Bacteroidota bacterium]
MAAKISGKILFVDDDVDVLHTARLILKLHFSEVITLTEPDKIPDLLLEHHFDVIILDMNFSFGQTSGNEGLFWLRKILSVDPGAHVLMNTAYGDIQLAVEAMKEGAIDFLVKPWEQERLLATVQSVFELSRAKKENKNLTQIKKALSFDLDQPFGELISKAKSMLPVFEAINKVAKTDADVLILGENGTGKELVARSIHRKSKRASEMFINVDLGAIPENLFESELFGHNKGAFTDASEDRMGRFQMAHRGTLFLDEIGNLNLNLQSKLLSVIQNRAVYKVGSSQAQNIDIRLICATNKPIYQMLAREEFRQDLLYRINTVEINLPPLRQRTEDIPLLVNHFLHLFNKKYDKVGQKFTEKAIRKLQLYYWPGNIRELQHLVERAVIMNNDIFIDENAILLNVPNEQQDKVVNFHIENVEKEAIQKALKAVNWNMTEASKILGYGRSTLYRKMKKYEL